jgi:ATP/maltotriose-dependent transcriptional regulator MalT
MVNQCSKQPGDASHEGMDALAGLKIEPTPGGAANEADVQLLPAHRGSGYRLYHALALLDKAAAELGAVRHCAAKHMVHEAIVLLRDEARERDEAQPDRPSRASEPAGCPSSADQAHAHCALSRREIRVVQLIADGMSNKGVARSLEIAPETVKTYVKSVLAKLGARTRAQAVARAEAMSLI